MYRFLTLTISFFLIVFSAHAQISVQVPTSPVRTGSSILAGGKSVLADEMTSPPSVRRVAFSTGGNPELVFVEECPDNFCPVESLDFGTVATGSSGQYSNVLLFNQSDSASATGLSFQLDAEFRFSPNFSGCDELPPGSFCWVTVKFAPTMAGPLEGFLSVSSAEGAEATLALTGTGGDDVLLYGQFHDWWNTMPGIITINNASYTSTPQYSSELADDFLVEDPDGWVVNTVTLEVNSLFPIELSNFDIYLVPDEDGLPGDTPTCSAPGSQVMWYDSSHEARAKIDLSAPCTLPPGHYWLRARATFDNVNDEFVGWGLQYLPGSVEEPPGKPSIHLNPPVWRNPGDGTEVSCTDWTPIYPTACGLEASLPYFLPYGAVFGLVGQEGQVIADEATPEALSDVLSSPHPNPASGTATFTIAVENGQHIAVEVFDMMGRRVQTLYDGTLATGMSERLTLDASTLPTGVYVVRATGEDFSRTQRLTVVQ